MTKAATIEALQIGALVIVVVLLSGGSGAFLLGFIAIPGDVAGFPAVVAGVVGWVRSELHWGQLRAKWPSPPHLKQFIVLSDIMVKPKNNLIGIG